MAKCLNAISKERVKNAAPTAAAATGKCISALRKIVNNDTKTFFKMSKICDPGYNPLPHVVDDVVDADNSGGTTVTGDALHAERLGMSCGVGADYQGLGTGGRLLDPIQWIDCAMLTAEQGALRQVHVAYPQGDVWLRDVRVTIEATALLGDQAAIDALDNLDHVRRWVDQGDGTVYDRVTGLTWEKKTNDSSIHDKDNAYTWSTGTNNPDGTVFTTFLNTLNGGATGVGNCTSSNGITQSGGFAGHCDWRLPTVAELQTILLEPVPCSTSPCIDQDAFGPTFFGPFASDSYWSSTSLAISNAWFVSFDAGHVLPNGKSNALRVRAVRGGL